MKEYKYIKCLHFTAGGNADCALTKPIPCSNNYFIDAFWMPIKHQIGEKLVFLPNSDRRHFSLFYNQIAAIGDISFPTPEQVEFCKQDSERVIEVALYHINYIMEHFYHEGAEDVTPFIDELRPIAEVADNTITLNGRLPMQEAYFIKKYWNKIKEYHQDINPGIRFKIHFSDSGTKISVSAELCRYNAVCNKRNLPKRNDNEVASHQLQIIICDLTDAVQDAAYEYAEACRKM